MSLTDMPRAKRPGTGSSRPARRVWRLPTSLGSYLPLRSRVVSIATGPSSVSRVFGVEPLRLLPAPARLRLAGPVAEVLGQLGAQRRLDHSAGEPRHQAARPHHLLGLEPLRRPFKLLGRQPGGPVDDLLGRAAGARTAPAPRPVDLCRPGPEGQAIRPELPRPAGSPRPSDALRWAAVEASQQAWRLTTPGIGLRRH
jgi:hypothetical protein